MPINLKTASGGSVSLTPANTAVDTTITVPAATGNMQLIQQGTAVASTSGTSIDFTGIPSWAKRITVMLSGTSLSGTSNYLVQLGSGSVTTTGYTSAGSVLPTGSGIVLTSTSGFVIRNSQSAPTVISGTMTLNLVSGNIWVSTHAYGDGTGAVGNGGGTVTLSGTLDRVRITTVNGTDTFDAGTINVMWEG